MYINIKKDKIHNPYNCLELIHADKLKTNSLVVGGLRTADLNILSSILTKSFNLGSFVSLKNIFQKIFLDLRMFVSL